MQTDIRFPIGLLFTIIGVLIAIFGFFTAGSDMYKHSLGININLWSGICMLAFGIVMLLMAMKAQSRGKAKSQ